MRKGIKIMNGFFQQRDSHRFTKCRWNSNTDEFDQKSIIDYIISTDSKMVKNVKVIPGISMDSDHRLVVTDIRIRMERIQNKEKRSVFKVELLKENGKKREYIEKVRENLEQMEEVGEIREIQETVRRAAEETLGRRWTGRTRKRHTKWWGEEVREAILRKTVMMRRWLKNRTAQTRELYVEARNEAERVKRRAKEEAASREAEEMMEDLRTGKKKIFRLAKAYRGSKRKRGNIKDKQGEILVRPTDINGRWTEHFRELLNVNDVEEEVGEEMEGGQEDEEEDDIIGEELEVALGAMKNGKAPGEDEIPIELIKEGGEKMKEVILNMINRCWNESEVPESWGKAIVVPIYKGKGDPADCNNYRGITLLDHLSKTYERILERRLRMVV